MPATEDHAHLPQAAPQAPESNEAIRGPTLGVPHPWRTALALGIFLFALFGLSGSKLRFGYEGPNIDQAEAILKHSTTARAGGGIEPKTQGGLLDVAASFPFTAVKRALERRGALVGFQQLVYPLAIPFYTTLLCLVFFALAYELYRRTGTAAALTIVLAATTTIWPYAKYGMETQQTLWTLVAAWAIARRERHPGAATALVFGIALAALMLTKITGPLQAAALAVAGWWAAFDDSRHSQRGRLTGQMAVAAAPCAVGVLVFLLSNHWRYGGWVYRGRYGYGAETQPYPLWDAVWAVAASPGKSIFLFSPPLFAALWFWGAFWRRFPAMRAVVVLLLAIGLWHLSLRPWADETWGPRRLHYLVPLALLPLGEWWERRGTLSGWSRWLVRAALAAGLVVQMLAISFDYTALAFVLGKQPVFSQENTVWNPQLCPVRFDLCLLESALARARGKPPGVFTFQYHYLQWTAPAELPPPLYFGLGEQDHFDFWPLQQRRDWPGRPSWFHAGSSWLAIGLAAAVLIFGIGFGRKLRRDRAWEEDAGPERGWGLWTPSPPQ